MSIDKSNYIIENNLTYAWGGAVSLILKKGINEIQPLIVTVNGFHNSQPEEDLEIRKYLDDLLESKNRYNSNTVANTIFPRSLWSKDQRRELLYERFRNIFPKILKYDPIGKKYGRYFDRMIDYGSGNKKVNQLEYLISTRMEKGNRRRSALQVGIIDPLKDHTNQPVRGFPCLQQIAFAPLDGGGLSVTGFYPSQYLFDRAYGNYLGLCWLGHFVAHEFGLELKEMTCIAGIGKLGKINKTNKDLNVISDLINKRTTRE